MVGILLCGGGCWVDGEEEPTENVTGSGAKESDFCLQLNFTSRRLTASPCRTGDLFNICIDNI